MDKPIRSGPMLDPLTSATLRIGVFVPVVYFGVQLIAALFYPQYSFVRQAASDLGSGDSRFPLLFNLGAMICGISVIMAALSLWRALWSRGLPKPLLVIVCACLLLVGLGNIWAGLYPLPDARHANNPFNAAFFIMPFAVGAALWLRDSSFGVRLYVCVSAAVFGALIALRAFGVDINAFEGLFQRVLALVIFAPISVASLLALRHAKPSSSSD